MSTEECIMPLLKTENISKSFGTDTVIKDINIHLNKGEIVSLLGVSGAGKTTLFNIISGLIKADSGKIYLNDENISFVSGKISYMLQKDLLLPHKKVIDNVSLPLVLKGKSKKEARRESDRYFKEFGLDGTQYNYPSQLSGGMRQRAALLRTYLASNGAALLDEPFSALDAITKSNIHAWYLDVMQKIDMSTLFITHDVDEAVLLSDRIYILKGKPATITDEIIIDKDLKSRGGFEVSEEFLKYKRIVLEKLQP